MKFRFKEKIDYGIFIICLIFSFLSWLALNLSKEYSTEVKIPVYYDSFFKHKMKVVSADKFVSLQLRGTGFDFLFARFRDNDKQIVITPQDVTPCNDSICSYKLNVAEYVNNLSFKHVQIEKINTVILNLKCEKLFQKKVPVKLNIKLNFEKQYQQNGEAVLSPADVIVYGSESELNNITYVETKYEDINQISKSSQYTLQLKSPIAGMNCLSQDTVLFTLPVSQFTESTIVLPISNDTKDQKTKFFPDKVEVTYTVALPDYKKVHKDLFYLYIHPDVNHSGKREVEVIKKPDFVQIKKINPEKVEYIIFE